MKKFDCLLLSALMVFSLSACSGKTASSTPPSTSTSPSTSVAPSSTAAPKMETLTLYIGVGEGINGVPCTAEKTPEALIAALAKETGWNLTAKSITVDQPQSGCLTVAFAGDSSIYTNPPDPQKEAYHVFDADDWVPTVLDSVAETLKRNLDIQGVAFSSPEGGDLEAGNEFVKFNLSSKALWDSESALQESEPENVSKAIEIVRKTMESRGEIGPVIVVGGEQTIDGEQCLTFSAGDNSDDGQKYTAQYHYAVSDAGKVWIIDVLSGPGWVPLGAK